MSEQAAKEFVIALIDDEDATTRADEAYLAVLESIASEKGFAASGTEIRDALVALKNADLGPDDDADEVSGFGFTKAGGFGTPDRIEDSLIWKMGSFEPLGFLRPTFKI